VIPSLAIATPTTPTPTTTRHACCDSHCHPKTRSIIIVNNILDENNTAMLRMHLLLTTHLWVYN